MRTNLNNTVLLFFSTFLRQWCPNGASIFISFTTSVRMLTLFESLTMMLCSLHLDSNHCFALHWPLFHQETLNNILLPRFSLNFLLVQRVMLHSIKQSLIILILIETTFLIILAFFHTKIHLI